MAEEITCTCGWRANVATLGIQIDTLTRERDEAIRQRDLAIQHADEAERENRNGQSTFIIGRDRRAELESQVEQLTRERDELLQRNNALSDELHDVLSELAEVRSFAKRLSEELNGE